jgi:uncharacterized membrane protein
MTQETSDDGVVRRVEQAILIRRTPMELYDYWRHVSRVPTFMKNVVSVDECGGRSHWVAKVGSGVISWDTELTDDVRGRLLAWKALGQRDDAQFCEVWFSRAAGGAGTVMRVVMNWYAPRGARAWGLEHVIGEDPVQQLADDLRRFKCLVEAGPIVTSASDRSDAATVLHVHDPHGVRERVVDDSHPTFAMGWRS